MERSLTIQKSLSDLRLIPMKTCFKCGIAKDEGDFYRHPQMADGLLGKCKDCTRRDVQANYRTNRDRYVAYDATRSKLPHRKLLCSEYMRRPAGKESHRRSTDKWEGNNREKRRAQNILNNAVRDGKIAKRPCVECGGEIVHGHHQDYSKPLDVKWLCPQHHKEEHKKRA